jgi:hypothetical protein
MPSKSNGRTSADQPAVTNLIAGYTWGADRFLLAGAVQAHDRRVLLDWVTVQTIVCVGMVCNDAK